MKIWAELFVNLLSHQYNKKFTFSSLFYDLIQDICVIDAIEGIVKFPHWLSHVAVITKLYLGIFAVILSPCGRNWRFHADIGSLLSPRWYDIPRFFPQTFQTVQLRYRTRGFYNRADASVQFSSRHSLAHCCSAVVAIVNMQPIFSLPFALHRANRVARNAANKCLLMRRAICNPATIYLRNTRACGAYYIRTHAPADPWHASLRSETHAHTFAHWAKLSARRGLQSGASIVARVAISEIL